MGAAIRRIKEKLKIQTATFTPHRSPLASLPSTQNNEPNENKGDLFVRSDEGGGKGRTGEAILSGAKGAFKYGAIGGMALGGLGAIGTYMTGNGSFRLWGLAIGAALGGLSGAIMGAQEVLDRPS